MIKSTLEAVYYNIIVVTGLTTYIFSFNMTK